MMAEDRKHLEPGNKEYDGDISGKEYDAVTRCQVFTSHIYNSTSGAPKDKRYSICKVVQGYCNNLIHFTRQANYFNLFEQTKDRFLYRAVSIELINMVDDMLPVIRRCRCFSPKKEAELHKKLNDLKISFNIWVSSDKKRLKENGVCEPIILPSEVLEILNFVL